ncbi:MAG: hypothetical protein M3Q76_03875 [Acidobacteriota bacterium]|nr:hypothetical protein [Acidobacteriota bacterium]
MFKLTAFGGLLVAALLLAACDAATGAERWTTHQDPLGFSIEIPEDWSVSNESGQVTVAGPNTERVTIYPLRIEGQLDANRAQHLMVGISNQMWPGQRWNMPKGGWRFGANGVRAIGADESKLRETTALWWANTGQGASGFFYAVAAPPARFKAAEPVFARILSSFRVTQATGGGSGGGGQAGRGSDPLAGLQFQRWEDPAERSFSLEVPAGWRTSGGLKRAGTVSKLIEVVAQSPDGQVVRVGDVRIPYQFIEPNQTLGNLGYREGQMYPGTSALILRFMPAVNFATDYIQRNVAQICSNLQWLRQADRADYVQNLASRGLLLERNQYTAGEVIFTCQAGGQPYVGYLFVETKINANPGVGNLWNVERLNGFMAPTNRATQADAVLQRMLASFDFNPQWWAAETGGDLRIKENMRRYREFSANLQQQTQNERWASWERRTEQTGDLLQGRTRVVDTETGEAYKVENTSNYYWIDTRNEVIAGTNIPYKPTWDFRELIQTYR